MAKRINSRSKGKRSELEARDLLRRCGIHDAERGARNGVKSGADIHSPMLERLGWRVEVKNVAGMRVGNKLWLDACQQAQDDAGCGVRWLLLWRPCRGEWAVTYQSEFWWKQTIAGTGYVRQWIEHTFSKGGSNGEA